MTKNGPAPYKSGSLTHLILLLLIIQVRDTCHGFNGEAQTGDTAPKMRVKNDNMTYCVIKLKIATSSSLLSKIHSHFRARYYTANFQLSGKPSPPAALRFLYFFSLTPFS